MSFDAIKPRRTTAAPLLRRSGKLIPELDGVRGLAILGVMAFHFCGAIAPTNAVERALVKVTGYGLWGVDLFFVLSGFLITGILLDAKGSRGYFQNFYIRRTLRIFPLYYAVLFLFFALSLGPAAQYDHSLREMQSAQASLWSYLTNYHLGPQTTFSIPYLSHFWSLAVEEHFYLVWPVVILLLSRRATLWASVLFAGTALVLRCAFASLAPATLYADVLTPCRLDALVIGAWFAIAARGATPLNPQRVANWTAAAVIAVLVVSLGHVLVPRADAITLQLRTTFLAILCGGFVYSAAFHPNLTRMRGLLCAPWLLVLGKYSYGLYVFHGIISFFLVRHPLVPLLEPLVHNHTVAFAMQVAAGVVLSILVSVVSYELFERRFLALKERFGNPVTTATVPAHLSALTNSPAV